MKKHLKRALSLLLAVSMVMSMLTVAVMAEENDEGQVLVCELSEHTHGSDCYETKQLELACELEESEGHAHGEGCYDEPSLVCEQEESDGHTHGDGCYDWNEELTCTSDDAEHEHGDECYTLVQGELTCTEEETEGHKHGEGCYEAHLTCELEEKVAHSHSDACYLIEKVLVCELEEHTHNGACYGTSGGEDEKCICAVQCGEAGNTDCPVCREDPANCESEMPETAAGPAKELVAKFFADEGLWLRLTCSWQGTPDKDDILGEAKRCYLKGSYIDMISDMTYDAALTEKYETPTYTFDVTLDFWDYGTDFMKEHGLEWVMSPDERITLTLGCQPMPDVSDDGTVGSEKTNIVYATSEDEVLERLTLNFACTHPIAESLQDFFNAYSSKYKNDEGNLVNKDKDLPFDLTVDVTCVTGQNHPQNPQAHILQVDEVELLNLNDEGEVTQIVKDEAYAETHDGAERYRFYVSIDPEIYKKRYEEAFKDHGYQYPSNVAAIKVGPFYYYPEALDDGLNIGYDLDDQGGLTDELKQALYWERTPIYEVMTEPVTKPVYVQAEDADGNPLYDGEGNPVYEQDKNADGTPKVDADGNPVYKQAVDGEGNPLTEYVRDDEGNIVTMPVYDDEGNPVYRTEIDADGNEVKVIIGWENYGARKLNIRLFHTRGSYTPANPGPGDEDKLPTITPNEITVSVKCLDSTLHKEKACNKLYTQSAYLTKKLSYNNNTGLWTCTFTLVSTPYVDEYNTTGNFSVKHKENGFGLSTRESVTYTYQQTSQQDEYGDYVWGWEATTSTHVTFNVVHGEPYPPTYADLSGVKLWVKCVTSGLTKAYSLDSNEYSIGPVCRENYGSRYYVTVRLGVGLGSGNTEAKYVDEYKKEYDTLEKQHTRTGTGDTTSFNVYYDGGWGGWYVGDHFLINVTEPTKPSGPDLSKMNYKVYVDCVTAEKHEKIEYGLIEGYYTLREEKINSSYYAFIDLDKDKYIAKYQDDLKEKYGEVPAHTLYVEPMAGTGPKGFAMRYIDWNGYGSWSPSYYMGYTNETTCTIKTECEATIPEDLSELGVKVCVDCVQDSTHHEVKEYDLIADYCTVNPIQKIQQWSGTATICTVDVDREKYIALYQKDLEAEGVTLEHTDRGAYGFDPKFEGFVFQFVGGKWILYSGGFGRYTDSVTGKLYAGSGRTSFTIHTECKLPKPTDEEVRAAVKVQIDCTNSMVNHPDKIYELIEGTYTVGDVVNSLATICQVTVEPDQYVEQYNKDVTTGHRLAPADQTKTITLLYGEGKWSPSSLTPYKTFTVICDETGYTVTYTDGVEGEEVFADQVTSDIPYGTLTPDFKGSDGSVVPTRPGYTFKGWDKEIAETVTEDAVYTAQWEKIPTPSSDRDPDPDPVYRLTIYYVYEDGSKAAPTHTGTHEKGYSYRVDSPEIEGYTPDQAVVSGRLTRDVTITVVYTAPEVIPDPEPTPDPDPEPTPTPDPEEPDEDLDDGETPLAELPDEPGEDLEDEEPPLAQAPQTGDNLLFWVLLSLLSAAGLALLAITDRKGKRIAR